MRFTIPFTLLAFGKIVLAMPTTAADFDRRSDTGSYTVSGLGTRKTAITAAGGTTLDMAIAMLETETMTADYTYGMDSQRYLPTCSLH